MADNHSSRTLQFSDAELDANRDGYMLPSQKQRIREALDKRFTRLVFAGVLMCLSSWWGVAQLGSGNLPSAIVGVSLIVLHLWVVYLAYLNFQLTRADMTKNDILMTEGNIRVTLKFPPYEERRVLHINDMKFDVPLEAASALWNGCYHCVYYTPNSKRLLSFERISNDDGSEFDSELGKRFRFDAETLAANRDGKLTDAQRTYLKFHAWRVFWESFWYSAVVWMPLLFFVFSFICIPLFIGLIWLLIILMTVLSWNESQEDLRLKRVSSVAGTVRWYRSKYKQALIVKGLSFEMSAKDYLLFRDGARYQIYFARQTKCLLSAEYLAENDDLSGHHEKAKLE
jgi:hypothetical protein